MNRREAIAALTALPVLSRIAKADVKSTDVIVAECDEPYLSDAEIDNIQHALKQIFPNNKIAVCPRGLRLKVMEQV